MYYLVRTHFYGENPLLWGQVCHLRELGYKVILVAWNERPRIQGDMYIQKDIKDSEGLVKELESRGLRGKVYGALILRLLQSMLSIGGVVIRLCQRSSIMSFKE